MARIARLDWNTTEKFNHTLVICRLHAMKFNAVLSCWPPKGPLVQLDSLRFRPPGEKCKSRVTSLFARCNFLSQAPSEASSQGRPQRSNPLVQHVKFVNVCESQRACRRLTSSMYSTPRWAFASLGQRTVKDMTDALAGGGRGACKPGSKIGRPASIDACSIRSDAVQLWLRGLWSQQAWTSNEPTKRSSVQPRGLETSSPALVAGL